MDKPRIAPLEPPYTPELAEMLRKWMPPGAAMEPLALFRTLARSRLLFERMRPLGGGLLNKGTLPARDRELLILRTCARAGAEYEWGVHAAAFGRPLGFSDEELAATQRGGFTGREALLMRAADELHDSSTLSDETLTSLKALFSDEQLLEILALVGFYHLISFLANGARVPLEPWAERFGRASVGQAGGDFPVPPSSSGARRASPHRA